MLVKKYFCFIFTHTYLLTLTHQREIIFDDVHKHTKLYGYIIKSIQCNIVVKCLQHCVLEERCRSVNYNKENKQCELMARTSQENRSCAFTDSQLLIDWMYYGPKMVRDLESSAVYLNFQIFCLY